MSRTFESKRLAAQDLQRLPRWLARLVARATHRRICRCPECQRFFVRDRITQVYCTTTHQRRAVSRQYRERQARLRDGQCRGTRVATRRATRFRNTAGAIYARCVSCKRLYAIRPNGRPRVHPTTLSPQHQRYHIPTMQRFQPGLTRPALMGPPALPLPARQETTAP